MNAMKMRLKFASTVNMGQSPSSEECNKDSQGIPFLQGNAEFGALSPQAVQYCLNPPKVSAKNSILLSVRAPVAAINIADQDYGIGRGLCGITINEKYSDTKFLYYLLLANQHQLYKIATGSTYDAVSREDVANLELFFPQINLQKEIASFLDRKTAAIDTLITKKQRLIQLLEEKRTALINQAVTKGLNPKAPMKDSGIPWIGEIPEHWKILRLKFLTTHVTSGSRGWAQYYTEKGAVFLRITNLSRRSIELDLDDIQYVQPPSGAEGKRSRVQSGDLLISITAYIGTVGVVPQDLGEAYVNQHIALTRPRQELVNSEWLGLCLFASPGQHQFNALIDGSTKDGLGLEDINNLFALVPPIEEQLETVNILNQQTLRTATLFNAVWKQINKLQEYRQSLINATVTGQLDVNKDMAT